MRGSVERGLLSPETYIRDAPPESVDFHSSSTETKNNNKQIKYDFSIICDYE
jgi:hypothetical protein